MIEGIHSLIFLSNTPADSNFEKFDKDLYPVIFQHIDFNRLGEWIRGLEVEEIESKRSQQIRSCTQHIIMAILDYPDTLINLEWLDVERMVAELFVV